MDFSALEAYLSICGGEQRIIPAHTDVAAREELRSALPDNDGASFYYLATKQLYASILGVAISAISRRALTFFMCHIPGPLFLAQT